MKVNILVLFIGDWTRNLVSLHQTCAFTISAFSTGAKPCKSEPCNSLNVHLLYTLISTKKQNKLFFKCFVIELQVTTKMFFFLILIFSLNVLTVAGLSGRPWPPGLATKIDFFLAASLFCPSKYNPGFLTSYRCSCCKYLSHFFWCLASTMAEKLNDRTKNRKKMKLTRTKENLE